MKNQGRYVNVSMTILDVFTPGVAHPHLYAATDESSRIVLAVGVYDGATRRNLNLFIKRFNKTDLGLALEE